MVATPAAGALQSGNTGAAACEAMVALPAAAPARPSLGGWRPRRRWGAAALGAVSVTLGGLLVLATPTVWRPALPQPTRPLFVTVLPEPTTPPEAAPPRPVRPARPVRPITVPRATAATPTAPAVEAPRAAAAISSTAPSATPGPAGPPAPAASAPAPLRLGPEVLRQAARDSVSETRRLAAAAGQPLGDADGPRLADDVAAAGKPDCLAANPGGSLLSIPIIAWQALRQKCR